MDNPFLSIDQRLENIESLLKLLSVQPLPHPAQDKTLNEETFSISDLANYLKKDKSTIHRYKNNRVFPFYKAGRTVFFKKSEVDAAMSSIQPENKKGVKAHG